MPRTSKMRGIYLNLYQQKLFKETLPSGTALHRLFDPLHPLFDIIVRAAVGEADVPRHSEDFAGDGRYSGLLEQP